MNQMKVPFKSIGSLDQYLFFSRVMRHAACNIELYICCLTTSIFHYLHLNEKYFITIQYLIILCELTLVSKCLNDFHSVVIHLLTFLCIRTF